MEENENKVETPEQKPGNNQMIMVGIAIAAVALIGVIAFSVKGNANNASDDTKMAQEDDKASDTMMGEEDSEVAGASTSGTPILDPTAKQINIEAGSYYYKPNVISVKKGEKVQIVMHSVSMMHNFNIDEFNVHGPMIKDGETNTIEFTPNKAGTFEYYCSVGQHRKLGQVGKITVTE